MQVITTVNGSHVFRNAPTLQTMIKKKNCYSVVGDINKKRQR